MGKIPITVTVDEEVFEGFKKLCEKKDLKVSTKVNTLMREWINNNEEER